MVWFQKADNNIMPVSAMPGKHSVSDKSCNWPKTNPGDIIKTIFIWYPPGTLIRNCRTYFSKPGKTLLALAMMSHHRHYQVPASL